MALIDDEFGVFFRAIPAVLLPVVVAAFWFKPNTPPPSNAVAFGCYSTRNGPNVRLDADGMHILQPGFPKISYKIELSKQGLLLSVDQPINAHRTASGYRFTIDGKGVGYLPFYRMQDGRWYGVFAAADIDRFRMTVEGGTSIVFEPVSAENCTRS